MSVYLQIEGDPTKWWPTEPFQASQIVATMQSGHTQTITLGGTPSGGALVLNGATLSFAVLVTPIVLGIVGPMPHD